MPAQILAFSLLVYLFVCCCCFFFFFLGGGGRGGGVEVTGSKFVPSNKDTVREICIIRRAKGNILVGTMKSCSFSNPKRDVCECSRNNIKLSECQRDISRHVQT